MLSRYPLQQGLMPTRRLYVSGSLEQLYLWINKQREFGPAIHRTLEFAATAMQHPFRTTPHIWAQEHPDDPQLWSFHWERGAFLPGLGNKAVLYAMPWGNDAILVHWANLKAGSAAQRKGLEDAVRQAVTCQDFIAQSVASPLAVYAEEARDE
jgi:hypothetical protein